MGESGAECLDDVVSLGDIPSVDRKAGFTVNIKKTFRGKLQQDCVLNTERVFRSCGQTSYNKIVC